MPIRILIGVTGVTGSSRVCEVICSPLDLLFLAKGTNWDRCWVQAVDVDIEYVQVRLTTVVDKMGQVAMKAASTVYRVLISQVEV